MTKEYICCFTGHRSIDKAHANQLNDLLGKAIDKMIQDGVTVFRNGGAVGFDTLAALKVIEKKKANKNIRLELFLPCKNQAEKWNAFSKEIYAYILSEADAISYSAESYTPYCMHARDKAMVEGSGCCIAYCLRSSGGSAFTLEHAYKHGLRIINLAGSLLAE